MPILHTSITDIDQEAAAAELAKLEVHGVGLNKSVQLLSEQFGFMFTRTQVNRLKKKDTYVRVLEEYKNNVVKKAVHDLQISVSNLIPKVVKVIDHHLDNNNLQAVPMAVKIIGGEAQIEDKKPQSQNLTIILPGSKQERDVSGEGNS